MGKIRLGVSACLLGKKVRFNGKDKLDPFIRDVLGIRVDFVPVCPEVECGLPVPREPIQLEGSLESPRLITIYTRRDLTTQMLRWAESRIERLERENLRGFIFKSRSPSCGMKGVEVYKFGKLVSREGIGLFAKAFMDHFPNLPVVDESDLNNPDKRRRFIELILPKDITISPL